MCKIGATSPFRSRNRVDHQRHNSEQIQRSRPISISIAPPTMQHMKRSSIYVSDASILLQHKNPMLSPTKSNDSSSPTSEASDFTDHYASLELPSNASIDDVRAAFRRLRGIYFSTDAVRYRAAQAAFDVLANPAARQDYDSIYRARSTQNTSSIDNVMGSPKRDRSDSAHTSEAAMPALSEEEEMEAARCQDDNWALKRHRRLYEPVMGTQPYGSYIPILSAYDGRERHPVYKSRRPVYVGVMAINARPN
jgi:hypothetical protein